MPIMMQTFEGVKGSGPLQRLFRFNWLLVFLVLLAIAISTLLLYSAANGSFDPWANRQLQRFGVAFLLMLGAGLTPMRYWLKSAYVFYLLSLGLLVLVEFSGIVGGGAARWIDLGFFRLQPSEVMKIALVMALARYFHQTRFEDVIKPLHLLPPLFLILLPAALVMKQPDLGTAIILCAVGIVIFFAAGVRLWKFAVALAAVGAIIPIAYQFLRDYQKKRLFAFMDPESDPLGAGYHIIQSKIALGSGGLWGKGLLNGTQIHLKFLPEMHTDFIFSILAEEFGFMGCLGLLLIYIAVMAIGLLIGLRARTQFARLLAVGMTFTFFLYVFINMAMVMGLLPVVGVPLPLISYGGTSMLSLMFGLGLLQCAFVDREQRIGRYLDDQ